MASPAQIAPPQIVDVPLALFGGMHSGVAPSDLPEGLSPDNQDMAYVPGETFSRPGLAKMFQTPFGSVAAVYTKTYVQPNGDPLMLAMDANGNIYVEDVANAPGVYTTLATVSPGISAFSASAFGREYIALSDLLHGQWPPLQYDGESLDRVTQDGPGLTPAAANIAPPTASIANTGVGTAYNIATLTPTDPVTYSHYSHILMDYVEYTIYTTLTIVTTGVNAIAVGTVLSIAGVTPSSFNRASIGCTAVLNTTTFKVPYHSQDPTAGTGGTATVQNPSLTRVNNIVTAVTAAAHGFQPGWQVQIAIANTTIGGGIASISRDGNGVVTVTTTTAHNCSIGSKIAIVGVTNPDGSFNGTFPIASVPTPTSFTYQQGGTAETSSAGTGNVQDVWTGAFFIQSTPSATTFTYQDTGPNDLTNVTGTATIVGQISPGNHGVVVMYLTRQGAITRPSPPIQFSANGGQQALITGLPIGPPNVVARILGFTGAGGDNYFIIPATPQVGGQIVGTSTVIPDNTSTSTTVDFSDNTLFDGIAIDQIGNDLFDQRVLTAPIGFYSYASRLACWGDFSKIENLLNMTLGAGSDGTTASANAGTGATSGGGTAWSNPSNVTSPTAYADVILTPSASSQFLKAEAFGFNFSATPKVITANFRYYYGVGGVFARLQCQLLQAGVAIGSSVTINLPGGGGGSAGMPLSAAINFPVGALVASDINNAAFGMQFTANGGGSGVHVFVNAGSLTVSTSTFLPQGWSSAGSTSAIGQVIASNLPGIPFVYRMGSAGGLNDSMISQPAFQDASGTFILSPSTAYLYRLYVAYADGIAGNLVAELFSPSLGSLATATLDLSTGPFSGFKILSFSAETPSAIPPDTLLRVYLQNVTNGATVNIAEMSLPFAQQPYTNNLSFWSYTLNPEGIAQTTGNLGATDDPSDIRCFSVQRNVTLLKTGSGCHNFQENDFEPDQWVVNNLSRSVGACSIRAGDPGQFGTGDAAEDWDVTANQNGLYLFAGGDFWKISQELDKGDPSSPVVTWEDINWAAEQTICIKNDPRKHRIYCMVPVFGATQPNLIFVLDYKELDTSTDLANAPSLRIGLTGKMLSTDKTRKWSRWNIAANCADITVRPGNDKQMTFAGGTRNAHAYGNLYTLDSAKLTDDDYGQIFPYYDTYFFVNHEQEQLLGVGTGRKLVKKICGFITGVGYVSIIPLVNSLQNPLPATSVRLLSEDSDISNLQNQDLEWTVGVRGERIAFRVQVQPAPGTTDVQLKLQKLIVSMQRDPLAVHRSSAI